MTLFSKIIDRTIAAKIVYEDESCLAFHDVNPQAPVHILLIPKKEITSMNEVAADDLSLLGHMMTVVPQIAKSEEIAERGYRVVINTNAHAGQTVPHLHLHIIGGRPMQWPPG